MPSKRFQLTNIKGPDGNEVKAIIHPEKEGCVVKFFDNKEKEIVNTVKNRKSGKEEKKQFSVFIPKSHKMVLQMLNNQKGNIVKHRNNPNRLFLIWERKMVETNFTLDGESLKATFTTSEKKDNKEPYWQTIFRFYKEDGKLVTHNMKEQEKPFTYCFTTKSKEEVTDDANCEWLLQEGQVVPREKYKGSLYLRLGKAPVKTSFTIDVDNKPNEVYAHTRVQEEKDENGNSLFMMKMRFYSNEHVIKHKNSNGESIPFVYSYMTNNPEHVTPKAIKQWLETTSGEIVPHKNGNGKMFLLFKDKE
jgi:hypothetical protein